MPLGSPRSVLGQPKGIVLSLAPGHKNAIYIFIIYLGNSVPNSSAAFSGSLVGVNKLAGFVTSAMV